MFAQPGSNMDVASLLLTPGGGVGNTATGEEGGVSPMNGRYCVMLCVVCCVL